MIVYQREDARNFEISMNFAVEDSGETYFPGSLHIFQNRWSIKFERLEKSYLVICCWQLNHIGLLPIGSVSPRVSGSTRHAEVNNSPEIVPRTVYQDTTNQNKPIMAVRTWFIN